MSKTTTIHIKVEHYPELSEGGYIATIKGYDIKGAVVQADTFAKCVYELAVSLLVLENHKIAESLKHLRLPIKNMTKGSQICVLFSDFPNVTREKIMSRVSQRSYYHRKANGINTYVVTEKDCIYLVRRP